MEINFNNISRALRDEIDYKIECCEDNHTDMDGFLDIVERLDEGFYDRKLTNEIKTLAIGAGLYRAISDDEIARTTCWPKGRAWDFKMNGIKYVWKGF